MFDKLTPGSYISCIKKNKKAIERLKLWLAIFFGFRKIDIEDSLEESLHWISGCLYRWTLCPCCAKCWWVLYNAYCIFKMWQFALDFLLAALLDVNRKNTLNLSLFKHVSQELIMIFWKKSEKDEWWRLPVYTIEIMENFEQLDFKRMAKRICLPQHSPSIFVENYRYTVFWFPRMFFLPMIRSGLA